MPSITHDDGYKMVVYLAELDVAERVEAFQAKYDLATKSDVINWLVKAALDTKLAPKGE